MSPHTPGPWHKHSEPTTGPAISIVSTNNVLVAEINSVGRLVLRAPESPEANAALIATAPELLEALEYLLERDQELRDEGEIALSKDYREELSALVIKAKGGVA